ncbi:LOW QUALITY PROTEIN: coiled-coil domain-containing protein 158 [Mergus octosetaceus]
MSENIQELRIEQLINEHEQEVAALTAKAKRARSYANSIQSQIKRTRRDSSLFLQVSKILGYKDGEGPRGEDVEDLEKQLHLAHSEVAKVQNERDRYNQECGNLNDRIHQLLTELHGKEVELSLEKEQNKRFCDRNTDNSMTTDNLRTELDKKNMESQLMKNMVKEMRIEHQGQMERQRAAVKERFETIVRISSLTFQLESTKERLGKVQDLRAKQIALETAERTVSNLMACLKEKETAIEVTNKEIKKLHSHVGSNMQELEHLKNKEVHLHDVSECETLKLQVIEKERIIEILQKQIDIMIQVVDQQYQTAGAMEVEKSQLLKEIGKKLKLQVQENKIAKEEEEVRIHKSEAALSKLELEKVKLVKTCTERLHAINDMKLEKDQLMSKPKAIRIELAGLAGYVLHFGLANVACCLVPASCAWHMISVLRQELQGPGYSSASASSKPRHVLPLPCLYSAAMPLPLNLASCAPHMLSKLSVLKEEPLQDLKRTPQELTSSDDNISSVDLGKNDSDAPHYKSRPKKVCSAERCRERSPLHLLLTAPPDDLAAGPSTSPEHRPSVRKSDSPDIESTVPWITSQSVETSEDTSKKLQNKMESLQNQVEMLQRKSRAMSSMIRTQEMKIEKEKEKEKKLSK